MPLYTAPPFPHLLLLINMNNGFFNKKSASPLVDALVDHWSPTQHPQYHSQSHVINASTPSGVPLLLSSLSPLMCGNRLVFFSLLPCTRPPVVDHHWANYLPGNIIIPCSLDGIINVSTLGSPLLLVLSLSFPTMHTTACIQNWECCCAHRTTTVPVVWVKQALSSPLLLYTMLSSPSSLAVRRAIMGARALPFTPVRGFQYPFYWRNRERSGKIEKRERRKIQEYSHLVLLQNHLDSYSPQSPNIFFLINIAKYGVLHNKGKQST